ncbi:hypothetical protein RFF05_14140 [Bengtsoniella intestinalis]
MNKPEIISQVGLCLVEPAVSLAVMGTCQVAAVMYMCGWPGLAA